MRRELILTLFLASIAFSLRADSTMPIDIARDVSFHQNLGAQVPLDLAFADDTGAAVRLGDFFHQRPVLLVLDYYRCPNLCGIVLNSLVTSLKGLTYDAGDRYDVVVVSIDPRDTPATSALKKLGYVGSYQRPQTASAWHFLTGSPDSIKRLSDTVGFHYTYDAALDQYAHPSGMIVLTPQGRTSRYFFGIEFPPPQIDSALQVAAASKINSPVYELLLLCCRYNPLQGKYGAVIFDTMRMAGGLTVLLLAGYVIQSLRREAAQRPANGGSAR
jgi:protein SCO1/2